MNNRRRPRPANKRNQRFARQVLIFTAAMLFAATAVVVLVSAANSHETGYAHPHTRTTANKQVQGQAFALWQFGQGNLCDLQLEPRTWEVLDAIQSTIYDFAEVELYMESLMHRRRLIASREPRTCRTIENELNAALAK